MSAQRTADNTARNMTDADLTAVLQIERNSQVMPWSRLSFEESLSRTHATEDRNPHLCRVLCAGEIVCGFHITSKVLDELHILNLAVAPQFQKLGIGHQVMADIIELAQSEQVKKIFLEVRASNLVARSLYQKWQFEQIAVRQGYYRVQGGAREDALIFVRQL